MSLGDFVRIKHYFRVWREPLSCSPLVLRVEEGGLALSVQVSHRVSGTPMSSSCLWTRTVSERFICSTGKNQDANPLLFALSSRWLPCIPGIPCKSIIYHSCLVDSSRRHQGHSREDSSLTSLLEIFCVWVWWWWWGREVLKLPGF